MSRPTVELELAANPRFMDDIAVGGVFVPGCSLEVNSECDLVVRAPAGEMTLPARVVYVDPTTGAGLELVGCGPAIKERLAELARSAAEGDATGDEQDQDEDGDERRPLALNVQERLRGLTLAEQVRKAQSADPTTRMALERMYGKNVWEALLRNPRLTAPEVARIARMGTLPRPQLEVIVGNGGWLQIPEVRRALLSNPRLGTDQIIRVLRLMPKHELKVASTATAYPFAVRDQAKRLLKND